jgi:hypothetical protein
MNRIRTPDRRLRLDVMARSAQRRTGGGILGHRVTSPRRCRIFRRSAAAAGLSSVTPGIPGKEVI